MRVCVCVCVYICMYVYVYISIYITSAYMYMYPRVRLRSSHVGLQWHVPCCMHAILIYRCNKQGSNVLLSIQFDTNVSQLLGRVLPWSYRPLVPPIGPFFSGKKGFFFIFFPKKGIFFFKKNWPDVRPDERLTSGVRRQPHPT